MTPRRWTGDGQNRLYYGDNLHVLRSTIPDESITLCYVDPPFNSKRNYNQIYNNIGREDRAQAQAFIDTWTWNERARIGYDEIISNPDGRFSPQLVDLVKGLHGVLGEGSLLAYIISMSLCATEIFRVLKPNGSFYLHCDPTASHYLKVALDAIFCANGGDFKNEVVWLRSKNPKGSQHGLNRYSPFTDTLLFYVKSSAAILHIDRIRRQLSADEIVELYPYKDKKGRYADGPILRSDSMGPRPNLVYEYKGFTPGPSGWRVERQVLERIDADGNLAWTKTGGVRRKLRPHSNKGAPVGSLWGDIAPINSQAQERLGYPTQKPEALLERIIEASSNVGDVVLDAYCGCGTTVAVAQRLKRQWIGIDITYQSISLILRRIEQAFSKTVAEMVVLDGIPRDMASARALANKSDDRLRKEFEKWAVLTYTNNRAVIREKPGADGGIDGRAYFKVGRVDNAKIVFQVKSGGADRGDVGRLRGDMAKEGAELGVLLVMDDPSGPMLRDAKAAGQFRHAEMGRNYDRIEIVTVRDVVEGGKRLEIPMSLEVLAAAKREREGLQPRLTGLDDGASESGKTRRLKMAKSSPRSGAKKKRKSA